MYRGRKESLPIGPDFSAESGSESSGPGGENGCFFEESREEDSIGKVRSGEASSRRPDFRSGTNHGPVMGQNPAGAGFPGEAFQTLRSPRTKLLAQFRFAEQPADRRAE